MYLTTPFSNIDFFLFKPCVFYVKDNDVITYFWSALVLRLWRFEVSHIFDIYALMPGLVHIVTYFYAITVYYVHSIKQRQHELSKIK